MVNKGVEMTSRLRTHSLAWQISTDVYCAWQCTVQLTNNHTKSMEIQVKFVRMNSIPRKKSSGINKGIANAFLK